MYLVHIFDEWDYNERLLTCVYVRFSHELYSWKKSLQIISRQDVSVKKHILHEIEIYADTYQKIVISYSIDSNV